MRKFVFFVLFMVVFHLQVSAQDVSCSDLLEYVQDEGYKKGEVSSYMLIESKWLKSVIAYSVDNTIVVLAEIKRDEWGYNTDKYIFCGIPSANWDAFYYGFYDTGLSYGERFHKYIINYQCDCK